MDVRMIAAGAAGALALFSAGTADAALVFAGSWQLTDGPSGSTTARSAQEIAAQLFGGSASDYTISSVSSNVADIDHLAHYLIFDIPGAQYLDAENAKDFFGLGISAFAFDDELAKTPSLFTNYAFRDDTTSGPGIPEPATWALMIGGFGLTGAALRRRRAIAA